MAKKKTRKVRRQAGIGPAQCHPKMKTRNGECLPQDKLKHLGRSLGAPTHLQGRNLKQWMIQRTRCRSERCWLDKAPMEGGHKQEIVKEFFRPTRPDSWKNKPNDWLDSENIELVMRQYEETYPTFKFYGAYPIDFSAPDPNAGANKTCIEKEICDLNLKKLAAEGKRHLGFIFNLDPHNKGGSHWIAAFTDIPAHKSYYFDSYGYETPPQIARFLRSLTLQDPRMTLDYCARRFQFSDSECGMYCMYFILMMIEGKSFKDFCRNPVSDKEMLKLRTWFYAPKDE